MRSAVEDVRNAKGEIQYSISSGNVFADLGLPNPELLLAKAELTFQISQIIEERGLTQAQAAETLGIDQPKVSALMRGKLSSVSMERLYRYLNALGRDVDIVVRPKAAGGRGDGVVRVVAQKRRMATAAKTSHHGVKRKTTTKKTSTKRLKKERTAR